MLSFAVIQVVKVVIHSCRTGLNYNVGFFFHSSGHSLYLLACGYTVRLTDTNEQENKMQTNLAQCES